MQAAGHRKAVKELEEKENRLVDLLLSGTIDKGAYDYKLKDIRDQRDHLNTQLEELNVTISKEVHVSVQKVFELAINAESQWKLLNRHERVEFLKKTCSNPVLEELTVRFELKKPFDILTKMKGNKDWRR